MNKRTALASTLQKIASSFQEGHGLRTDLNTMSFALQHMGDDRFASIYAEVGEGDAGDGAAPATTDNGDANEPSKDKETAMKQANSVTGEFWCKAASDLVIRNLAFSVVGSTVSTDASSERPDGVKASALPSEDVPNGTHQPGAVSEGAEPVPASALSKEQTPDVSKALNSDMVAKAEAAPLQKAASDDSAAGATTAGKPEEEKKPEEATPFTQEACGIHLATATMGYGINLSAAEQAQLEQLF